MVYSKITKTLTGYAAIANIATSDDIASCKPEQGLK
jgi:hypothetical protein